MGLAGLMGSAGRGFHERKGKEFWQVGENVFPDWGEKKEKNIHAKGNFWKQNELFTDKLQYLPKIIITFAAIYTYNN